MAGDAPEHPTRQQRGRQGRRGDSHQAVPQLHRQHQQAAADRDEQRRDAHPRVTQVLALQRRPRQRQQRDRHRVDDQDGGGDPNLGVVGRRDVEEGRPQPYADRSGDQQQREEDQPDDDRASDQPTLVLGGRGPLPVGDRGLQRLGGAPAGAPHIRGPLPQHPPGAEDLRAEPRNQQRAHDQLDGGSYRIVQSGGDRVEGSTTRQIAAGRPRRNRGQFIRFHLARAPPDNQVESRRGGCGRHEHRCVSGLRRKD